MSIFLTGGTGFIGSSVLRHLVEEGYSVVCHVRSQEKAGEVEAAGAEALLGSLGDAEFVERAARESDGVIHAASTGNAHDPHFDDALAVAILSGLEGSNKPYIHTGGIWTYGNNDHITEESPANSLPLTAWRAPIERRVLDAHGVRTVVIAPAAVFGYGKGLPTLISNGPRTEGGVPALRLIGDGNQHWTTVHADDLAALYILALAGGEGGSTYIGASGQNPTVRELGEAAAKAADIPGGVEPETADETRRRLGAAFADALLLDQQAPGSKARVDLGWEPNAPTLIEEFTSGSYVSHGT